MGHRREISALAQIAKIGRVPACSVAMVDLDQNGEQHFVERQSGATGATRKVRDIPAEIRRQNEEVAFLVGRRFVNGRPISRVYLPRHLGQSDSFLSR